MDKRTEKLIIRNAIIKGEDFLSIGGAGVLLYISIQDITSIWTILMIAMFAFLVYKFIKRLKNRKPQIIIDEIGIKLCEENLFYNWNSVKYAFIKSKTTGYGKNSRTIDYFHIESDKKDVKKRIDDYKYSRKAVKEAVEHYSGKDIGDYSDQFRDKIFEILDGYKYAKEITHSFSAYQRRVNIWSSILFFGIIGMSVYFQVATNFKYCIGVGFVIGIFSTWYLIRKLEKEFKRKRYISDLSTELFDKIAIKHSIKYSKKQMNGYLVFFGIVAIAIFVISLYATQV